MDILKLSSNFLTGSTQRAILWDEETIHYRMLGKTNQTDRDAPIADSFQGSDFSSHFSVFFN